MNLTALLFALITLPSSPDADQWAAPLMLEFSSPSCGPCRQMKPVIAQLKRSGYPIKAMEIDNAPDLAARYKVERVPTFVVIDPADGRQIDRSEGARSAQELAKFYNQAVAKSEAPVPPPAEVRRTRAEPDAREERETGRDRTREDDDRPAPAPANPKPWETVVRIKVHGQGSIGFGSGTIIHSTPEESIILTCAHIFKMERGPQYAPAQFPRRISIDLFDGRLSGTQPPQVHYSNESHEGRAIDYDFVRDVGLIRIKPGRRLPYARVVPTNWTPEAGKAMITVGCSEGRDATAWSTKISNPTMRGRSGGGAYDAIECMVAPKQGRSGGGLFTYDGFVAGVCDFAEPMGNHGLYAAPSSIYALLDRNKLMALYSPPAKSKPGTLLAKNPSPPPATRNAPALTRAQSPDRDESGNLTIPPPEMLGIKRPVLKAKNSVASSSRRNAWHSPPSTRTTDLKMDPTADPDHFETGTIPADRVAEGNASDPEALPEPMKVRQISNKWRPGREALPELSSDGAN